MKTPDDKDSSQQDPSNSHVRSSESNTPKADTVADTLQDAPTDSTSEATQVKRPLSQDDKTRIAKARRAQQQREVNKALQGKRQGQPPLSDEGDDRTRVAKPKAAAKQTLTGNEQDHNKTVIKPSTRAGVKPTKAPLPLEGDDQTRLNPRNAAEQQKLMAQQRAARKRAIEAGDKTQFNPKKRPPKPAPAPEGDKTRLAGPAKKAAAPAQGSNAQPSMHVLKNRFVFEQMLGAGGMGMVYKAKDLLKIEAQDRDPYVAIKVLGEEFKSHPEAFIALQRESRKTQLIAHPNIVNVFDFDKDGDTVFMTMEFLDGKPLDKLISQYKATGLPEEDTWKILEGICAALNYAHGESIIHSDFKPGNIFVTNKGTAKVFDFGIARAVAKAESHEDDPEDRTVFDAGNLGALTPAYASSEMLEGEEPDIRDDIYALGCIAYEMFTGRHPFDRVHANEAERLGLKPSRIPELSKLQWRALEAALAFSREDRVASVEEFWEMMTRKKQSFLKAGIVTVIILVLLSSVAYLFIANQQQQDSGISEDDVRNEIELQLRIEQYQGSITNLLRSLEFSQSWEDELWDSVQGLQKLSGEDSPWLIEHRAKSYAAYLVRIERLIGEDSLEGAARLIESAPRYAGDADLLAALKTKLVGAIQLREARAAEDERKQRLAKQQAVKSAEQKRVEKQKRDIFDQAMKNVSEQTSCRSGLNLRDLNIAITKLREVDIGRYNKSEDEIVKSLSSCISKIGRSFPERATEYKKQAMRLFPKNSKVAAIPIIPKDPCDSSLAGLGSRGKRAICKDRMAGEEKAPALVVIPAKGSIKAFAIGKYEVSIEEFNQYCTDSGACKAFAAGRRELPVTDISIAQAKGYLKWLSDKSKREYRLPTKAEWEYAARAGSGKLDSNRNCRLNSRGIQKGDSLIKTDVGAQNRWGLVNHVGNAREWVAAKGGVIVAVGGSYETAMEDCIVNLSETHSGKPDDITGFRVLREIVER